MRKAVPLGLVTTALLSASPALARKRLRGTPGGNAAIAIVVAIIFAPAARYRDYQQWQLMPFPGSRVATADGSWAELFPVSFISMVLRALGLCWVLQRTGRLADQIDDAQ